MQTSFFFILYLLINLTEASEQWLIYLDWGVDLFLLLLLLLFFATAGADVVDGYIYIYIYRYVCVCVCHVDMPVEGRRVAGLKKGRHARGRLPWRRPVLIGLRPWAWLAPARLAKASLPVAVPPTFNLTLTCTHQLKPQVKSPACLADLTAPGTEQTPHCSLSIRLGPQTTRKHETTLTQTH